MSNSLKSIKPTSSADISVASIGAATKISVSAPAALDSPVVSAPAAVTSFVVFDSAQPALVNNRTMVPMRKIFEALGAEVTWDNETQTAKALKDNMSVEITIGSNVMYSSGKPIEIDSPALLMRSRTYVPVRFISNALGAEVDWDNDNRVVYITTK